MDVDPRVRGQPGVDFRVFVGRVVVHHQVQLRFGIGTGQVLEEGQELLVAVPVFTQPVHLAGGDLERGEQGRDLGLLVHTEHDRVLRWGQVQTKSRLTQP